MCLTCVSYVNIFVLSNSVCVVTFMQICHAYIWNVGPGAGRPRHGVLSEFVCTGNKCTSETQQQQATVHTD